MEKSAQSLAVHCPRHKGADRIRQVSAVYAEAAPLSLSPMPALRSADRLAWTGTICGGVGAILLWTGVAVKGEVSGITLAIASLFFVYALACYGLASVRRANIVRVRRGMPSALTVWAAGWYCERCDGVFFTGAAVPAGAVAGEMMSPGQFQHLVWEAGGYSQLTR